MLLIKINKKLWSRYLFSKNGKLHGNLVVDVINIWPYAHRSYGPKALKWCMATFAQHRFSAFRLRSKCSICSYQLNIWYVVHWTTTILNWFLRLDDVNGIYSAFVTGWPGIAVPPGSAHSLSGEKLKKKKIPSQKSLFPLVYPSHPFLS